MDNQLFLGPSATFLGLYEQIRAGSIECFQGQASRWLQFSKLSQAVVGKTTDALITVDIQLSMDGVCKQFGSYVRLKCEKVDEPQTVQHVKNIGVMLQCEECDLWRLLYSKRKLS